MTKHRTPWAAATATVPAFDDDVWELYSDKDWTQANDLAKQMPEKLHELQRLFLIEATRYKVLPFGRPGLGEDEPRHRRPAGPGQGRNPTSVSAAWDGCWKTAC